MLGDNDTSVGIVPTPVGVNRSLPGTSDRARYCPHARGGEPTAYRSYFDYLKLSPRPWG